MQIEQDKFHRAFLRTVDVGERAILCMCFAALALRLIGQPNSGPYVYIVVFAEGLTVAFVLLRRYTQLVTVSPFDWAVAFLGTLLPLLVASGGEPLAPVNVCGLLMFLGLLTSLGAKLSLRRSFGIAAANRGVKVAGLYRLVRHPMYLGYGLIYVGFLLMNPTWRNLAVYAGAFVCQVLRIFAEERHLQQDPLYRNYMDQVRYRLVPGLF